LTSLLARDLLDVHRGEGHPDRSHPHLVAGFHRRREVGLQLVLQRSHGFHLAVPPGAILAGLTEGRAGVGHDDCVRKAAVVPLSLLGLGVAGIGYASVVERNWFRLRRFDVPVLARGQHPIRILHISDLHLTPRRTRLIKWVRSLATLNPDLVVNTGDTLAHPDAIEPYLHAVEPLLDRPGLFV